MKEKIVMFWRDGCSVGSLKSFRKAYEEIPDDAIFREHC
jgi:hypothetical protein